MALTGESPSSAAAMIAVGSAMVSLVHSVVCYPSCEGCTNVGVTVVYPGLALVAIPTVV